jgi:hypothetical protein
MVSVSEPVVHDRSRQPSPTLRPCPELGCVLDSFVVLVGAKIGAATACTW